MSILVFDSGIGGLSVLRELRLHLPGHRMLYVGDDAGFPYGNWEETVLTERIVNLFDALLERCQPDIAVIACNTASTLILPALRSRFDIPFVGVVPAIKPAAERTASGLITILATPGTVRRRYTRELIEQFAGQHEVNCVGATRLARLAEDYLQGREVDSHAVHTEIAPCFVEKDGRRTDIITLSCTHYPFLLNLMRQCAPWPVDWLDPAEAVARRTVALLQPSRRSRHGMEEGDDQFLMTSGIPHPAHRRLLGSFGLKEVLPGSGISRSLSDAISSFALGNDARTLVSSC